MVEPIKITYRNGAYYANRPNWDGGDVVMASEYAALKAENEEQRERLIQFANAFDAGYAAAERALAERAGGVKVLRNVEFTLVLRDDAVSLWCGSDEDAQRIYSAIEALTTEPAAPEGRQDDDRIRREMDEILRKQSERDIPFAPSTRPAQQAVAEAMVEAAWAEISVHHPDQAFFDADRSITRAALKAAMEAGRHG